MLTCITASDNNQVLLRLVLRINGMSNANSQDRGKTHDTYCSFPQPLMQGKYKIGKGKKTFVDEKEDEHANNCDLRKRVS